MPGIWRISRFFKQLMAFLQTDDEHLQASNLPSYII